MTKPIIKSAELKELLCVMFGKESVQAHYGWPDEDPYCITVLVKDVQEVDFEVMLLITEQWEVDYKWKRLSRGSMFVIFQR